MVQSVRHIELVQALAEHRNFGRAATALGVSQPSLTRSLKHLEDRLCVPLFDRAGVTPTLFGEIVLKHGRSVVAGFAELRREIAMARGLEVGELTVAMGFYPADISGHAAAARLCRRHPNLSFDLRVTDWSRVSDAVLADEVDFGFADIRAARENPDFVTEPVRAGPVTFFCAPSHPLAEREEVSLEELTSFPWAGPSLAPPLGANLPRHPRPCGTFKPSTGLFHPRIGVESFASAKQIVLEGGALSAGFPFQIEAELAVGELVLLRSKASFLDLDYGFVMKRGRALSPAARAFMTLAREVEGGKGAIGPNAPQERAASARRA